MREQGRPGGGRSVGEGAEAGQQRKCARESGGEGAEAGQYRKCAREGGGRSMGEGTGAGQHRKCAREGGRCRWVPQASAEEGMEARNGL